MNSSKARMLGIASVALLALLIGVGTHLKKQASIGDRLRLDLNLPQPYLKVFLEFEPKLELAKAPVRLIIEKNSYAPQRLFLSSASLEANHLNVNLAKRAGALKYTILTLRSSNKVFAVDLESGELLQPQARTVAAIAGSEYFIGHLDFFENKIRFRARDQLHQEQIKFRHALTATAPVKKEAMLRLVAMASLAEGSWTTSSIPRVRENSEGVWIGWLENPDWQRSFEIRIEKLSGRLVLSDVWNH